MALQIGQAAPEISLYDTDKNLINLSTYKGKNVVVLFFPLAFTGVCTTELCNMRDSLSVYNNLNAEVIAISVDSLFTLQKFKESQQLNFTLLSDFNKVASDAYGCLYEKFAFDMQGVSKRSAFVIDKEGILQHSEILEVAGDLPDFNKIKNTLEILNQ